jgi:hypothetical protein
MTWCVIRCLNTALYFQSCNVRAIQLHYIIFIYHSFIIHLFIPLAAAACDDSLPFSGASSIPLCYVLIPATLLH